MQKHHIDNPDIAQGHNVLLFALRFLLILALALVLVACGGSDNATATSLPPTEAEVTAEVEVTEEAEPTEQAITPEPAEETQAAEETEPTEQAVTVEPTEEPTEPAATEEVSIVTQDPAATAEVIIRPNASEDGDFHFTVVDVVYGFTPTEDATPPAGEEWVLVRITMSNNRAEALVIDEEMLSALDASGNRYAAGGLEGSSFPEIIGMELTTGEPMMGFALFTVPQGVELVTVEWCPTAICERPLSVEV